MFNVGDRVIETRLRIDTGAVIAVRPNFYAVGDDTRRTGVWVRWDATGVEEWVSAALLAPVQEKPITFAQYLGMPETPRDDYVVDDSDANPFQDMLYLSDYRRAVEFEQAHYALLAYWRLAGLAYWELELLDNPVDNAHEEWAREWYTAFDAVYPDEKPVPVSPDVISDQVVGYFV